MSGEQPKKRDRRSHDWFSLPEGWILAQMQQHDPPLTDADVAAEIVRLTGNSLHPDYWRIGWRMKNRVPGHVVPALATVLGVPLAEVPGYDEWTSLIVGMSSPAQAAAAPTTPQVLENQQRAFALLEEVVTMIQEQTAALLQGFQGTDSELAALRRELADLREQFERLRSQRAPQRRAQEDH